MSTQIRHNHQVSFFRVLPEKTIERIKRHQVLIESVAWKALLGISCFYYSEWIMDKWQARIDDRFFINIDISPEKVFGNTNMKNPEALSIMIFKIQKAIEREIKNWEISLKIDNLEKILEENLIVSDGVRLPVSFYSLLIDEPYLVFEGIDEISPEDIGIFANYNQIVNLYDFLKFRNRSTFPLDQLISLSIPLENKKEREKERENDFFILRFKPNLKQEEIMMKTLYPVRIKDKEKEILNVENKILQKLKLLKEEKINV